MRSATEDLFEVHRVSGRGLLGPINSSCVAFITWLAPCQDGQIPQKADTHLPTHLSIAFPSISLPTVSDPTQLPPGVRIWLLPLGQKATADGMTQDPFVNSHFLRECLGKSVDSVSVKLF